MQEFRRPEWSAHISLTDKTLTGLSEQDLLLLATVLTANELACFYVLNKTHEQWQIFQDEKQLHKPLALQRGVKWPDTAKVKSVTLPPIPPPVRARPIPKATPVPTASAAVEAAKISNPVRSSVEKTPESAEIIVESNESLPWSGKVSTVKWPVLTFKKELGVEFQFLCVRLKFLGRIYNLTLSQPKVAVANCKQALILPSPESVLFKKNLLAYNKSSKSK